jgi:hypothetical protein
LPTYEPTETFLDEYARLAKSQRAAFKRAVEKFVEDIGRWARGQELAGHWKHFRWNVR